MKNKLKSAIYKAGIGASVLAGFLLTSKDALAQNIASNQKNKPQIANSNINTLKVDPFDRVKWYVNTSDPVEVAHYDLLLKTEKTQKESHILGLKVALLALYNDTTIPPQDKKALALIIFEQWVNLSPGTKNREFYAEKYMQRLENDQNFFDLCVKFGEMQWNLMAEIANSESIKIYKEWEQIRKEWEQIRKEIALLEQILDAFQKANK